MATKTAAKLKVRGPRPASKQVKPGKNISATSLYKAVVKGTHFKGGTLAP